MTQENPPHTGAPVTREQSSEPLAVEFVAVGDLRLDPENARSHNAESIAAVARSLERFGQRKPVVATRAGVVIAGNGTLTAARELGWEHVAVAYTDLEGDEARAFAIADNRTAELSAWSPSALASFFDTADEGEPAALGFTAGDVEKFQGLAFAQDLGEISEEGEQLSARDALAENSRDQYTADDAAQGIERVAANFTIALAFDSGDHESFQRAITRWREENPGETSLGQIVAAIARDWTRLVSNA